VAALDVLLACGIAGGVHDAGFLVLLPRNWFLGIPEVARLAYTIISEGGPP